MLNKEKRIADPGSFPKVVLLDTITHCNLRCSMCGHPFMTRKKGKMSMPLFKKIIDEIESFDPNTRVWMVYYGEALMLKYKLLWMINYAKNKGLTDIVLNSNGTLLTEEMAIGLIDSGLDAIYIGIDAFNQGTYEKLRVGGDYDNVVKNVSRLLELKTELGVAHPEVYVQFVEMEDNFDQIEDFKKFWSERGAIVKIRPKVTWAGTVEPFKMVEKQRYPCHWGMQSFNILWDGKVTLCAVDYDGKFIAGDVSKQSIREIWSGKLKDIRKIQVEGKYHALPDFCRDCKDWQAAQSEYYQ
ncbi:Radical SAM superfamily protein [anaerobic digester metagenome]